LLKGQISRSGSRGWTLPQAPFLTRPAEHPFLARFSTTVPIPLAWELGHCFARQRTPATHLPPALLKQLALVRGWNRLLLQTLGIDGRGEGQFRRPVSREGRSRLLQSFSGRSEKRQIRQRDWRAYRGEGSGSACPQRRWSRNDHQSGALSLAEHHPSLLPQRLSLGSLRSKPIRRHWPTGPTAASGLLRHWISRRPVGQSKTDWGIEGHQFPQTVARTSLGLCALGEQPIHSADFPPKQGGLGVAGVVEASGAGPGLIRDAPEQMRQQDHGPSRFCRSDREALGRQGANS